MITLQRSMPVRPRYAVPSLAIRVWAIFLIYAKTTAALARVGCHRTLMKISECLMLRTRGKLCAQGGGADRPSAKARGSAGLLSLNKAISMVSSNRQWRPKRLVHFHELIHVIQWRLLGSEGFLRAYANGLEEFGYENSPLEKMAYDAEASFKRSFAIFDAEKFVSERLDTLL